MAFSVPEKNRITVGRLASDKSYGNNGAFEIVSPVKDSRHLFIIASDGMRWEHVSVHVYDTKQEKTYTPVWFEMCFVKDVFWGVNDCVIQYHAPRMVYVNNHKDTLHLWRQAGFNIPTPPMEMV